MKGNTRDHILVLGMGVSGKAAAALLLKQGKRVIGVDKKADALRNDPEIVSLGIPIFDESVSLEGVGQVVLSPGVPQSHRIVREARAAGIEVIGEIELAFRGIRNRCIGITGSNGKTTTVLLTTHILNCTGMKARALGNVGVGLSSYLLNPDPEEILVVELSSFQLETLREKRLDLAVVLNLTPNHLDRHASMQEYAEAKLSIQECLKPGGKLLVSKKVAEEYGSSLKAYEIYDSEDLAPIQKVEYMKLGVPERQNVEAAFAIAKMFGVSDKKGLETFRKPPHRIEWVADIDGVSYYNDSKSSNIDSAMHAVRLFDGPIVLIAGGTDKGSSYRPWIECFKGRVKKIVAYGLAAPKMEAELAGDFPFEMRALFRDAVLAAREAAAEKDTVLLSPGCSSYDQFASYERRGDAFKQIVKEFAGEKQWTEKKQS